MKKLLILIIIVSSISLSASAQRASDHRRYDKKHYSQVHKKDKKKHIEKKVATVNKKYDRRIAKVKNDPTLRNKQKNRKIKSLEKDRKDAIVETRRHYSKKHKNTVAKEYRSKDKRRY